MAVHSGFRPIAVRDAVGEQATNSVEERTSRDRTPGQDLEPRHNLRGHGGHPPNSDTPYSMVCLDLRAKPMVISVPAVAKTRYSSVQLIDGNTYNYAYIGEP